MTDYSTATDRYLGKPLIKSTACREKQKFRLNPKFNELITVFRGRGKGDIASQIHRVVELSTPENKKRKSISNVLRQKNEVIREIKRRSSQNGEFGRFLRLQPFFFFFSYLRNEKPASFIACQIKGSHRFLPPQSFLQRLIDN